MKQGLCLDYKLYVVFFVLYLSNLQMIPNFYFFKLLNNGTSSIFIRS